MKRFRVLFSLFAVVAVVLLLAACGAPAAAPAPEGAAPTEAAPAEAAAPAAGMPADTIPFPDPPSWIWAARWWIAFPSTRW